MTDSLANILTRDAALPDHGDRFARMWLAYHNPPSRWHHTAAIVAGAVSGLAVAWVLS